MLIDSPQLPPPTPTKNKEKNNTSHAGSHQTKRRIFNITLTNPPKTCDLNGIQITVGEIKNTDWQQSVSETLFKNKWRKFDLPTRVSRKGEPFLRYFYVSFEGLGMSQVRA